MNKYFKLLLISILFITSFAKADFTDKQKQRLLLTIKESIDEDVLYVVKFTSKVKELSSKDIGSDIECSDSSEHITEVYPKAKYAENMKSCTITQIKGFGDVDAYWSFIVTKDARMYLKDRQGYRVYLVGGDD